MSLFNSVISGDHQVKSIVFGYIRKHESLKSVNIPSVISYTCLKYYFINEFFDKAPNNYFEISNDKMMITNIGTIIDHTFLFDHTIYCHQWIPTSSNIMVKWTFFIKKLRNGMFFGLASNDNNTNKDFCINGVNGRFYQVQHTGVCINGVKGPFSQVQQTDERYSQTNYPYNLWKSGDTVTFILDLINKSDQFCMKINDQPQTTIFNNIMTGIDIKYKMAIQIPSKDDCVILKNFQESYS